MSIAATYATGEGARFKAVGMSGGAEYVPFSRARSSTHGTFYISYDSILDRLYLSTNGYWRRANSSAGDWVVSGLLRGRWSGKPVELLLGGIVQKATLPSGAAYLDNFVLDTGTKQ